MTKSATKGCATFASSTFAFVTRQSFIRAEFEFRDGLIRVQRDRFDFWRWSRQALGTPGLLLGWTPMLRNKVREKAQAGLEQFLAQQRSA